MDVEISRWGDPEKDDLQFLIQPPEEPHYYRFSTKNGDVYEQGGTTYEFTWNPDEVSWYSPVAGGHFFTYTTEEALAMGQPNRVQCLPANMEIRLNLWNMNGGVLPMEMSPGQSVEVVIGDFVYEPNGVVGVEVGGVCAFDCQCVSNNCGRDNLCQL